MLIPPLKTYIDSHRMWLLDFRTDPTTIPSIDHASSRVFDSPAHLYAHDYLYKGIPIPKDWLDLCSPWIPSSIHSRLKQEIKKSEELLNERIRLHQNELNQPDTTGAERP